MSSPAPLPSRSGRAIEPLGVEGLLTLLHVEDSASELVGEDGEGFRLTEAGNEARVELLSRRIVAQERDGSLGEGPLQVDVALLSPSTAAELAARFGSRGDEPGIGGELLHGVEAIEVGDLVEEGEGEDLADARDGAQAVERSEIVGLGGGDELALEIRDESVDRVEKPRPEPAGNRSGKPARFGAWSRRLRSGSRLA